MHGIRTSVEYKYRALHCGQAVSSSRNCPILYLDVYYYKIFGKCRKILVHFPFYPVINTHVKKCTEVVDKSVDNFWTIRIILRIMWAPCELANDWTHMNLPRNHMSRPKYLLLRDLKIDLSSCLICVFVSC
jgi:hypothetical protein